MGGVPAYFKPGGEVAMELIHAAFDAVICVELRVSQPEHLLADLQGPAEVELASMLGALAAVPDFGLPVKPHQVVHIVRGIPVVGAPSGTNTDWSERAHQYIKWLRECIAISDKDKEVRIMGRHALVRDARLLSDA